jgi:hypothetical protein
VCAAACDNDRVHLKLNASWCLLAVGLGICAWVSAHAQAEPEPPITRLPVVVHMAQVDGHSVAEPAFVAERIQRANEIFAPYGVAFVVQREVPLAAQHARLESRADRDALGAQVTRKVIDCFVVESLRDVDDPERMRRGVHWHARTRAGAHYVIISTLGGPGVLAHELGHYLGNPEHSQTLGNLMSYTWGDGLPVLDADQLGRLRRSLRGYIQRGDLVPTRDAHAESH